MVIEFIIATPDILRRCIPVPTVKLPPFEDDPDVVAVSLTFEK